MKEKFRIGVLIYIAATITACQNELEIHRSTKEFLLQDGFSIEMIAAEPLLDAPVAMSFDDKGRMWLVELTGYMRDIDGSNEQMPDGKIIMLEDKNDNGRMDTRHVIIDSLIAPRTLLHAYGGLLYSNGASLYWSKIDDIQPGPSILVDSLYVVGGNIEHQPNNLLYHLDNWIYSANATIRYRLKDNEWLREPTTFRGQWGLSHDTDGRMYYNNNSLPLAIDYVMPGQLISNPFQKIKYNYNDAIATSNRLYPFQPTAVNRGYQDGVLDEEGKVRTFTSACAPLVYTGDQLGEDFFQNVLVCAPEANLIKRYALQKFGNSKKAVPVYDNAEFLISKDETFRPVNLYNAPDGSLYVIDMRKGVIQHRAYMTSYLREKILERGLDKINGRGRIYKVFNTDNPVSNFKKYYNLTDAKLIEYLGSSLPFDRKYAQQQLVFNNAVHLKNEIEEVLLNEENPYGQLYAMWTLEGLDLLDSDIWLRASKLSNQPIIHETLIRLSSLCDVSEEDQLKYFKKIAVLKNQQIDNQLAVRLGQLDNPSAMALLLRLSEIYGNNPKLCEAIISGISGREEEYLRRIRGLSGVDSLHNFLKIVITNKKNNAIQAPQMPRRFFKDNRTAGFDLYNVHCASCHSLDGKGQDNLAPPLLDSEYVSGSKDRLILLTLHGMKGPVTVNGQIYEMNAVMPGLINNPDLSDKDIADLLVFLRNSFSFSDTGIYESDVSKWRKATKDRNELFTEKEFSNFVYELQ